MRRWGRATGTTAGQLVAKRVTYMRKGLADFARLGGRLNYLPSKSPTDPLDRPGMVIGIERIPSPRSSGYVAAAVESVNVPRKHQRRAK